MTNHSRIDIMVRATILSRPKKIAICPFAEEGMMAKQILNQRYGIEETYIIDNRLAELNPNIIRFALDIDMPDSPGIEKYVLGNWGD